LAQLISCLKVTLAIKLNIRALKLRFNCSFNPLTFTKLRFWPPKKKNYKTVL